MRRLGISLYPNHTSIEECLAYIELAAKYGFQRIFTCLISVDDQKVEQAVAEFKQVTACANQHGMEVIADVDPAIFKKFKVSFDHLEFFKEIGLSGIRLDLGFSGFEESVMTFNPQNLKIELNASNGTKYVDNILSYQPKVENILGCHNFFPHVYTGLGYDHFVKCSKQFKKLGIPLAAFVNSTSATVGPWPVTEGLCTLEMHRELPIEVQAKHLFATGFIDDVIIANAFATEGELKALSEMEKNMLEFTVELVDNIPALEKKIVLDDLHFNRGDVSDYVVRSTHSRVKYKGYDFPPFNTPDAQKGDILIESSLYDRYAGELQVARLPMKNSGKTNIVGKIVPEEVFLLDYLEPWMKFKFVARK